MAFLTGMGFFTPPAPVSEGLGAVGAPGAVSTGPKLGALHGIRALSIVKGSSHCKRRYYNGAPTTSKGFGISYFNLEGVFNLFALLKNISDLHKGYHFARHEQSVSVQEALSVWI